MYNIDSLEETKVKIENINIFLNMPISEKTTTHLSENEILRMKHPTEDLCYFPVTLDLQNACQNLSNEERALLFNYNDLKTTEYLSNNGFLGNEE